MLWMVLRRVLCGLCLLGWAGVGSLAWAQDHITERAWLEETDGPWTLEQVQSMPFEPYQGLVARGYGRSAVWLRLRIDSGVQHRRHIPFTDRWLVLRIRPAYLDKIELFDPLAPNQVQHTGDLYPRSTDAFHSLNFNFMIPHGNVPRDVWLRVETSSSRVVDVHAQTFENTLDADRQQELLYDLYLALLVVSVLWAVLHWSISRERVLGVFVIKQTFMVVWSALLLGYARAMFEVPFGYLNDITCVSFCTAVILSQHFDAALLQDYHPPSWVRWVTWGTRCLFVIELVFLWLGRASWAMELNAVGIFVVVSCAFVLIVFSRPERAEQPPALSKGVVVVLYGVIFLVLFIFILIMTGHLGQPRVALDLVLVHGLLTGSLMVGFLQVRAHKRLRLHTQISTQLAIAQEQARQDRSHREDQEKLFAMLAHELKTPLSTVRMLISDNTPDAPLMRSAIHDMNEVIERCIQTNRLTGQYLNPQPEACDVHALLQGVIASNRWHARVLYQHGVLPAVVKLDCQILSLIVVNMLNNACKYCPADSEVQLLADTALQEDGRRCLFISVSNLPGHAGWPDAKQVFEKYYRSPHARRQVGSGLGLFLMAGWAQVLGGQVSYQPTDTHIRFVFTLQV